MPSIVHLTYLITNKLQPVPSGVELHYHQNENPEADQNPKHCGDVFPDWKPENERKTLSLPHHLKSIAFRLTWYKSIEHKDMFICRAWATEYIMMHNFNLWIVTLHIP